MTCPRVRWATSSLRNTCSSWAPNAVRLVQGFCAARHWLTRLRGAGLGYCASHINGGGAPPGKWFKGAPSFIKLGCCCDCHLGVDKFEALIKAIMAHVRQRAKYKKNQDNRLELRENPLPVDPKMEDKIRAQLSDPSTVSPGFGVPYDLERKSFFQPSADSILGDGDYREPLLGLDGTWTHYWRLSLRIENVAWANGLNWEPEDALRAMMALVDHALFKLYELVNEWLNEDALGFGMMRSRHIRIRRAGQRVRGRAAEVLGQCGVAALLRSADDMAALARAHNTYVAEGEAHAAEFTSWYTKGALGFDSVVYGAAAHRWDGHTRSDSRKLKLNTASYRNFKKHGLPLLLASRGRSSISYALLSKYGMGRPSFNRRKRKLGHNPHFGNLEVVEFFLNGPGNSQQVEDDVMTTARLKEICLISTRLQLTRVQRLALEMLMV